ncbi:MAG: beta-lactamase family protein [Ignavibacterium sp.]|nr:beta-lactamase family protein [Ignavibacterium sp.]
MSNEEKIDKIFSDYNKPDVPGAAVMVIENGEIIFEKSYGLANVEKNLPVTEATNFRLASVTKQFTAMSILMLIDRGQLKLETTLKEIFPNFPDYGKNIKIKNLLQHTSGLIDYEDLIPDTATLQVKDQDVLNLIMQTDSTYFQPGSQHQYSNTGYALLALTVEKISGKSFRDFLRDNIFQPLGMDNTIAFEKDINEVRKRAYGYTIKDNVLEFTDQSITSAVLGDGGIYSSLNDLYKWDQALYTGKLIDKKYLDESWTRGMTNNGIEFPYGYGWRLEKYHDIEVVYHTGSTRGFRNIIYRMPEKKFTIVILTNRDAGSEFSTLKFAHQMIDYYFPVTKFL